MYEDMNSHLGRDFTINLSEVLINEMFFYYHICNFVLIFLAAVVSLMVIISSLNCTHVT